MTSLCWKLQSLVIEFVNIFIYGYFFFYEVDSLMEIVHKFQKKDILTTLMLNACYSAKLFDKLAPEQDVVAFLSADPTEVCWTQIEGQLNYSALNIALCKVLEETKGAITNWELCKSINDEVNIYLLCGDL